MTDHTGVDGPSVPTATRSIRRGTMAVGSLLGAPLLLLYAWLLAWFSPEVTGSHEPAMPGMHPEPPGGAVAWVALLIPSVAAASSLVLGWARLNRPGRWWWWPLVLAGALVAGFFAADVLARR